MAVPHYARNTFGIKHIDGLLRRRGLVHLVLLSYFAGD
jgi:hypothetical protein